MSLGRLCSNSLISSATTTSRNLTSAPRGCKIYVDALPHLPGGWGPPPPCKRALTFVIPSVSDGRNESLQRIFFHYLRHNEHPIDFLKDQGRDLRRKAQKFVLEDGALFFIGQKNGQPERWVHSRDEQQQILKACHSNKLAGHIGRDKTREKVCT